MSTFTINDKPYDLDALSGEAKAHIASIQFVDAEIKKAEANLAVLKTARVAYGRALNEALPDSETGKK